MLAESSAKKYQSHHNLWSKSKGLNLPTASRYEAIVDRSAVLAVPRVINLRDNFPPTLTSGISSRVYESITTRAQRGGAKSRIER